MTYEQSKAARRRDRDPTYAERYFVGKGIDVGAGADGLSNLLSHYPRVTEVRDWDLNDGDAMLLMGVADASMDFLTSSHCLEHMFDPFIALSHWVRVIRPGGYLILTVPDFEMYEHRHFPSRFNSDHKWTFSVYEGKRPHPRAVTVFDLLHDQSTIEAERIIVIREGYDPALGDGVDQTASREGPECSIEIVLRKKDKL